MWKKPNLKRGRPPLSPRSSHCRPFPPSRPRRHQGDQAPPGPSYPTAGTTSSSSHRCGLPPWWTLVWIHNRCGIFSRVSLVGSPPIVGFWVSIFTQVLFRFCIWIIRKKTFSFCIIRDLKPRRCYSYFRQRLSRVLASLTGIVSACVCVKVEGSRVQAVPVNLHTRGRWIIDNNQRYTSLYRIILYIW